MLEALLRLDLVVLASLHALDGLLEVATSHEGAQIVSDRRVLHARPSWLELLLELGYDVLQPFDLAILFLKSLPQLVDFFLHRLLFLLLCPKCAVKLLLVGLCCFLACSLVL